MHDLFAVSRMHYDMAGYRIARPPMGWADSFWLLLLNLHGADSRNRTCPDLVAMTLYSLLGIKTQQRSMRHERR